METKGIPVALMTAEALGVPLVIARRMSNVFEGTAVNINYVTGSSGHIETMSLSRRAVQAGQRALIVDDFLKGGGTARGMIDLMGEFAVEVIGMAFVMETVAPANRRIHGERALMVMDMQPDEPETLQIQPAAWLSENNPT
jgi:purine operon repressor